MNLFILPADANRYYAFCVCNISYRFAPIPYIFYKGLSHSLKMSIWFRYHPQIIICQFLTKWTKSFFWPKLKDTMHRVYVTPPTVLLWFLWNLTGVKDMIWKCAYFLNIIFRVCFVTFFTKLTESFFPTEVDRYYVSCVCNSSYSFTLIPFILYRCIGHGLKMCISFGYDTQISVCCFSQIEFSRSLSVFTIKIWMCLRLNSHIFFCLCT